MMIFFYFEGTATSLIWGQLFAMIITMPIELGVISQKVLKTNWFYESIVFVLPSVTLFATFWSDNLLVQAFAGLLTLILGYIAYIRYSRIDFKLLTE